MMRAAQAQVAMGPVAPAATKPEDVEGLHLYAVDRPVTLATGESKQLILIRTVSLPVKREYVVRGRPSFYVTSMAGQPVQGGAEIEATFKNETPKAEARSTKGKGAKGDDAEEVAAGLGIPLPAGTVRAYGEDESGAPQFLGEDHIDHVPEGGDVRLRLGRDLDIPVVREQTAFARASDTVTVTGWRITVRNTKAKTVTVRVDEPLSANWEIARESEGHTTSADGTPEWLLTVPPKGMAVLEYNVKAQP
jgi:hypothetical protein